MAKPETSLVLDVNAENEQVVLGAITNDPEAWRRELPRLREGDFAAPAHKAILRACQEVLTAGGTWAPDTVHACCRGEVDLRFLLDLTKQYPALPEKNLEMHLAILRRDAVKLSAAEEFAALYEDLEDPHADLEVTTGHALGVLKRLRDGGTSAGLRRGRDLYRAWDADLREMVERKAENFRQFYFSELDKHLYEGLRPGRLVVIAARPSMGKSTFCSNLIWRQVVHGRRVLAVPVEDGTDSVIERVACLRSGVPLETLIKTPDELTPTEMRSIRVAASQFLGSDLVAFDDEMPDIDALEMRLEEEQFDVVILDLFEYLLPSRFESGDVTSALRRLKRLAKRRKCAIVVVHQIRRIKRTKNTRPKLSELKNSGGYEEVTDLALLLHRTAYYDPDAEDDVMEIRIAKQRRGPRNVTVGFEFHGDTCKIGKSVEVESFGGE